MYLFLWSPDNSFATYNITEKKDKIKDVYAHCYCAFLVAAHAIHYARAWYVIHQARAPSKNVVLMAAALTWCENIFVGCTVTPTFFSVDHFLLRFFTLKQKTKKILCVGSFNYFAFTIHMGSHCYINRGVRDLEVALFKANSTWRNGITSKNLLNRPIHADINTHTVP